MSKQSTAELLSSTLHSLAASCGFVSALIRIGTLRAEPEALEQMAAAAREFEHACAQLLQKEGVEYYTRPELRRLEVDELHRVAVEISRESIEEMRDTADANGDEILSRVCRQALEGVPGAFVALCRHVHERGQG